MRRFPDAARGGQYMEPNRIDQGFTLYATSQNFGENLRKTGEGRILYNNTRFAGGINAAVFRPISILNVVQADHFEISVLAEAKHIEVRKIAKSK